jgi:hypothetical protein
MSRLTNVAFAASRRSWARVLPSSSPTHIHTAAQITKGVGPSNVRARHWDTAATGATAWTRFDVPAFAQRKRSSSRPWHDQRRAGAGTVPIGRHRGRSGQGSPVRDNAGNAAT